MVDNSPHGRTLTAIYERDADLFKELIFEGSLNLDDYSPEFRRDILDSINMGSIEERAGREPSESQKKLVELFGSKDYLLYDSVKKQPSLRNHVDDTFAYLTDKVQELKKAGYRHLGRGKNRVTLDEALKISGFSDGSHMKVRLGSMFKRIYNSGRKKAEEI